LAAAQQRNPFRIELGLMLSFCALPGPIFKLFLAKKWQKIGKNWQKMTKIGASHAKHVSM
jgi:hypothetical protein